MDSSDKLIRLWRKTTFEIYEERLALSAQPVLAPALVQTELQPDHVQVAATLAETHEQTGVADAHALYGLTGAGQAIAVIDTGIAYDHTALGGGFGPGYRVIAGYDFAENDADPYDDGPLGFHGTHVAGIIASDNPLHEGVAPGVDLIALRVFDDYGRSQMTWIEQALRWVHQHRDVYNITAVNLSLGTDWNSSSVPEWATLEDELAVLEQDGVFIAVAAGNSFTEYAAPGLSYPAASPHVVPVASHGPDGSLSRFSQRDARVLVAPGENIVSTIPSSLLGLSGPSSYFMAATGTSMAAPYVAGASALLREAMTIAGYQTVTQDAIYNVLRETADPLHDAQTGLTVHRINLSRALDTILADDFGSTPDAAYDVGAVADGRLVSGTIGRLDDIDYFTFTAAQTGTLRLTATATHELAPRWLLADGQIIDGTDVELSVVAGQKYTFGITTGSKLGSYQIDAQLVAAATQPSAIDWGTIDAAQITERTFDGQSWYRLTAARDATLTIEATPHDPSQPITMEIYSSDGRLLAAADATAGPARIDIEATAHESLLLRVRSPAQSIDFRVTNLVHRTGSQVDVFGTAGDDRFSLALGDQTQLVVNGTSYRWESARINDIRIYGGDGTDQFVVTGTAAGESVVVRPGSLTWQSTAARVRVDSVESVSIRGGGGNDRLTLYDSLGDDQVAVRPGSVSLRGDGYEVDAEGFSSIDVRATAGHDRAVMYDSQYSDQFYGYAGWSMMRGRGFANVLRGFDRVEVVANSGGYDRAWLFDSAGDDTLTMSVDKVSLQTRASETSVAGFRLVYALARSGGHDTATILTTPGISYASSGYRSTMLRDATRMYVASGFDQVDILAGTAASAGARGFSVADALEDSHWAKVDRASHLQPNGTMLVHATAGGHASTGVPTRGLRRADDDPAPRHFSINPSVIDAAIQQLAGRSESSTADAAVSPRPSADQSDSALDETAAALFHARDDGKHDDAQIDHETLAVQRLFARLGRRSDR